jgi:hypothetical protein
MHKNNEGGTGHKFSITVNVIIIIFRLVDSTIFTVCLTGPALVIFMHKRDNPHTHTHYFVLTADVEGKDCKTMQRPNIKKAAD